ncbi:MAG: glycosyltransferase family 2 protein [Candidatus Bathyarchaeota archaeon]|nr:glycosyltransferase family 2 protein [Candidatus Bathyarchaeota archaeon]
MTDALPFVSVIILNYNGRSFLYGCLSSLSQMNYPKSCYEVIMVDNGSVDGSVAYVEKNFPWVKILALSGNYGYTGGNNRGVNIAKGDLVVFLNNDTIVDKEWLRELVNVMHLDEEIAICGSKVILMDDPNHVQYSGGFLNLLGGTLFYPFHWQEPNSDFCLVGSICGASFLMRKVIFGMVGGFDEDFFMYSDENDLCLRVWVYGYRVAYAPRSVVYHFAGGSSPKCEGKFRLESLLGARLISPLTIYHGNKNSIASIIKNFEFREALVGVIFSFFYCTLQLLLLLKKADSKGIVLLSKAVFWPIKNFRKTWKKRLIIQKNRKLSDQKLIKANLLIPISDMLRLIISWRLLN